MITSTATYDGDESIYAKSFGNFPTKQAYHAGLSRTYGAQLKSIDMRKEMGSAYGVQCKSLNTSTGGTGTAGNALIPVYLDSRIVDISRKFTPLTELVPRVSNQGTTADYIRVTAKGAATTDIEDASLTDVASTRARVSKTIKYLYSVGRVTGQAEAAIPAFTLQQYNPTGAGNVNGNPFSDASAPNAMQQEVLLAARALKELEENLIINGNATTSVGSGPDGSEFDGIVTLQSTTNQTDLSGAALTWDNVEGAVRDAFNDGGRPNLAIASTSALIALRKIMIDSFRMSPADMRVSLGFGISSQVVLMTIVGDIPVIPSMYLDDTAAARSIYFLDMDWIEMRVLLDMTYQLLAQVNDSRKFYLKIYECLIMRAPEFNASIVNIA